MRLARLRTAGAGETIAALLNFGGRERLVDLIRAATSEQPTPPFRTMESLVESGRIGLDWLQEVAVWVGARQDAAWEIDAQTASWLTPLPPRAIIAAGRNFRSHREESARSAHASAAMHAEFPTGFVKLPQTLVPHRSRVEVPPDVSQLDYEAELAVVVGRGLIRASRGEAHDAIFGYTVFNDLSARDWQMKERKNNLLLVGKNLPGFGPLGPCILTADEVADPSAFMISLTVNGEQRQRGSCADMIFSVDELVSFWSRIGLRAGDIIATGTPEGVALHRKPDPAAYFLKPGDVVSAAISGIGVLEVTITAPSGDNP